MWGKRDDGPIGVGDSPLSGSAQVELAAAADFDLGRLHVQPSTLQLVSDGNSSTLEPRVMQALIVLAQHREQVVSRDQLVTQCWDGRAVSEDAINRCIAKVRRVGAASAGFQVETIPRVGYRLLEHAEMEAVPTKRRPARWLLVAAPLLLLIAAAGLLLRWGAGADQDAPRVAVGGFVALNQGSDAGPYSASITAAVSDALVGIGARLTSGEQPIRTPEEARRAGADLIVGGTVRKEGDKIRVIANVESGRTGTTLVTQDFEAPVSDAASLPDRVAASLASTAWLWVAQSRFEPDPAINDEIVRIINVRGAETKPWNMARQLARANPDSASAQAALAYQSWNALSALPVEQRAAALAAGRDAAKRASRLRPEFGYLLPCHLTAPSLLSADCDKALRRAVATDPQPPFASMLFASQLLGAGLVREADSLMASALADSPYDGGRMSLWIFAMMMETPTERRGDLPAIRARAQRYAPDSLKDAFQYEWAIANGDFAAASAMLNDPLTGHAIDNGLGKDIDNTVFRAVKTRVSADVAAARGECLAPRSNWLPSGSAFQTCIVGFTMLGDLESAFRLAGLGYRNVECCTPAELEKRWLDGGGLNYPRTILFGSAMAPFRADPRFITIARHAGLLAYWKSGHPPDFCDFERVPVCMALASR